MVQIHQMQNTGRYQNGDPLGQAKCDRQVSVAKAGRQMMNLAPESDGGQDLTPRRQPDNVPRDAEGRLSYTHHRLPCCVRDATSVLAGAILRGPCNWGLSLLIVVYVLNFVLRV